MAAMWQSSCVVSCEQSAPELPPLPSSHVTTIAVSPARYAALPAITPNQPLSQASPVATGQSWVSLHRLGVTNEKAGSVRPFRASRKPPLDVVPIGTSDVAQALASGV